MISCIPKKTFNQEEKCQLKNNMPVPWVKLSAEYYVPYPVENSISCGKLSAENNQTQTLSKTFS